METKERKVKGKGVQEESFKDRVGKWISKSPKLEKFVDNTGYFIKHPDKFTEKINEIYQKATNTKEGKSLSEFGGKIKSLYRMGKMTFSGEYDGIPKSKVILGFVAFAYLISPIDLLPDFLPFIGFVDDAALMIWFIKEAAEEVEKFEKWEGTHGVKTVNPAY
ncbi:MAG: DUF1232 domain-containing protein [Cytophagaceae bacterium]|nr:DUF1232 domain-containing protein [Cytophagaceae bacterium]